MKKLMLIIQLLVCLVSCVSLESFNYKPICIYNLETNECKNIAVSDWYYDEIFAIDESEKTFWVLDTRYADQKSSIIKFSFDGIKKNTYNLPKYIERGKINIDINTKKVYYSIYVDEKNKPDRIIKYPYSTLFQYDLKSQKEVGLYCLSVESENINNPPRINLKEMFFLNHNQIIFSEYKYDFKNNRLLVDWFLFDIKKQIKIKQLLPEFNHLILKDLSHIKDKIVAIDFRKKELYIYDLKNHVISNKIGKINIDESYFFVPGNYNFTAWTKDDSKLAVIYNESDDFLANKNIFIYDIKTKKIEQKMLFQKDSYNFINNPIFVDEQKILFIGLKKDIKPMIIAFNIKHNEEIKEIKDFTYLSQFFYSYPYLFINDTKQ